MWASGARLEGMCGSSVLSVDWKEASNGAGGWLATGCSGGTVGVSWIGRGDEECSRPTGDKIATGREGSLYKSHFILRGHIGEVQIVRWMPSGMRLATYDSWGRIIIWCNRANVLAFEFHINTAVLVTDMQWSPCGYYLIACAKSGHIMCFSGVTGLNLFSVQIEATACQAKKAKLTSCSWNRPGTRVAFGTSNGEVIVLDPANNGSSLATITIKQGIPVQSLEWYGPDMRCQKRNSPPYITQSFSVCLRNGDCVFFQNPDCSECVYSRTGVVDGKATWSLDNSLLVVVGYSKNCRGFVPIARFLNLQGYIVFSVSKDLPMMPRSQFPLKNVCWGLQDSIVMLTCGSHIYTLKVDQSLPTLESLCQQAILSKILGEGEDVQVEQLPLPSQEISRLTRIKEPLMPNSLDTGRADIISSLYEPLPNNHRLHCTLERIDGGYILKLEHINSYIPLLQAKRRPRKRGSVQTSYVVELAFDGNHSQLGDEDDDWLESVSSSSLRVEPPARSRPSFLKQLWAALNPVHNHGVMDATQGSVGATAANGVLQERMALAEIEGNSFTNRYKFHTSSPLFQDGFLGSVNICTNYIKCKPRKLSVVLPTVRGEGAEIEELVLFSKDPEWNNDFQIYELDFGGRVSRDSIKNFQIELDGQVVLQFGKADTRLFCLDLEAPFSVVQALCVALACIV